MTNDDKFHTETTKDNYGRRKVKVVDLDNNSFIECRIVPGFMEYHIKFNGHEGEYDNIYLQSEDVELIYQALKIMLE